LNFSEHCHERDVTIAEQKWLRKLTATAISVTLVITLLVKMSNLYRDYQVTADEEILPFRMNIKQL